MDPDTNGTPPPGVGGSGSPADAPSAALQPVAFLAALEEHRAHFSPAHLLAVLVIRLDRFSHACDTIGPARAQLLRAEVKRRATSVASMPVAVQWLGPADLGVACVLSEGSDDARTLSEAISQALAGPFLVDKFELFLSSSIGSAVDQPDTGTERLLQQAFDAMLQVNRRGGAGIGSASRPPAPRMATLLAALPSAIDRGELSLQLQPRACLGTGTITAYTVRLRWQHPVLGRVAPQDFLPAAEALGMMNAIGGWTLQHVLPLLRDASALGPLQFTLLATSSQMQADDTIAMLRRAIASLDVAPGQLCVEVPVDIVPDSAEATDKAARLRDGGVGIALADFTDSPASHAALARVQPDMVTLDARHLGHAAQPAGMAANLQRACEYAKARGVAVCAKGVETAAQLDVVRAWGCDTVQGFLLAQPFPAAWLQQTHPAIAARARQLLKR